VSDSVLEHTELEYADDDEDDDEDDDDDSQTEEEEVDEDGYVVYQAQKVNLFEIYKLS
jgi:hypothetical protein